MSDQEIIQGEIVEQEDMFFVVINLEEQYSIWPTYKKEIPYGWEVIGEEKTKSDCLNYIKEVWTDMRPLSLKKAEAKNIKKQEEPKKKLKQSA